MDFLRMFLTPVSLFGESGQFTARVHFGILPAKLIYFMFKETSKFRRIYDKLFIPLIFLLGIPFNMIAKKEEIK